MPYGIITNCAAVFLGGILGAVLKNYFPQKLKEALPNIFGLSAITMGISLIIMLKSLSAVVLALIVGTVIGELLNLEDNLLKGLHKLEQKLPVNLDDEQMDVLISMIILFCFSGTGGIRRHELSHDRRPFHPLCQGCHGFLYSHHLRNYRRLSGRLYRSSAICRGHPSVWRSFLHTPPGH